MGPFWVRVCDRDKRSWRPKTYTGLPEPCFSDYSPTWDFTVRFVDASDLAIVEQALDQVKPAMLCFEPVSNPLLRIPDSMGLVDLAHRHGVTVLVDNSFASPYLLRPAAFGADLVVESATKYLGGHGDVMAGIVACDSDFALTVRTTRTATGAILGPFEAWLVLRGLRTLAVRVRRQCESALTLARWLDSRPEIGAVHYPCLSSHPAHQRVAGLFTDGLGGGDGGV